jgi:hypothetical protein
VSRQKTTQVVSSRDNEFLKDLEEEVQTYRGLRTKRVPGQLTIFLMDSDKYWRKQNKHKRKRKDEQYGDYADAR